MIFFIHFLKCTVPELKRTLTNYSDKLTKLFYRENKTFTLGYTLIEGIVLEPAALVGPDSLKYLQL